MKSAECVDNYRARRGRRRTSRRCRRCSQRRIRIDPRPTRDSVESATTLHENNTHGAAGAVSTEQYKQIERH